MGNNKSKLQIKHADWPYILQYFALFFVLIVLGALVFREQAFISFLIVLSVFFLILTQFHLYRLRRQESNQLQYKIQCINELNKLLPLNAPLPPMNGWAATPELAVTILKYVNIIRPKCVVELGSGVSTLVAAYALQNINNPDRSIISIEHDPDFAEITSRNLRWHQLAETVDLRVAELTDVEIQKKSWRWYNPEKLIFKSEIDLLIIDGPPVKTQKNARYPALPLLYQHLSPNAVVILDDTKRPAEADIIKKWLKDYDDFTATEEFGEKGITILERRADS